MKINEATAKRIIDLCDEAGITVHSLCIEAGVPPSTGNDFLKRNTETTTLTTLKKLCDGLDITITEFFSTKEFRRLEQEVD